MHRAGLEAILGIRISGAMLHLDPCLPTDWPDAHVAIRFGSSRYEVSIDNSAGTGKGVTGLDLDGVALAAGEATLRMLDDGQSHAVGVRLGPARPPA
jgi:cyclic beta-1,2-glucan synthetase